MTAVQRIPCEGPPSPGSTFRPLVRFSAGGGDDAAAVAVLGTAEVFDRQEHEYLIARMHWQEDALAELEAVVAAAVAEAGDGVRVHLLVQATQPGAETRIELARRCGLRLFQEKEGFWWSSASPAGAARLTLRPLRDGGRAQCVDVVGRCVSVIGDRVDQLGVAAAGPERWAENLLDTYATGPGEDLWFLAHGDSGSPVGFVGLEDHDGDGGGTIVHIGVLPEHRGHGHGVSLVEATKSVAVERGWNGLLSLVDSANAPMVRTMLRTGFTADGHPWHKWHYFHEG